MPAAMGSPTVAIRVGLSYSICTTAATVAAAAVKYRGYLFARRGRDAMHAARDGAGRRRTHGRSAHHMIRAHSWYSAAVSWCAAAALLERR